MSQWRVEFNSKQILADFAAAAKAALEATGMEQEQLAKVRLWPGHGVDTEAMRKSTHTAGADYPWEADHVEPGPGAPERGGVKPVPSLQGSTLTIATGSGQNYAIYYHEKHDPFVRLAVERVNLTLPAKLEAAMRAKGYV